MRLTLLYHPDKTNSK